MSTQALEFNSASEMRAHYKAVRERLNPKPKPINVIAFARAAAAAKTPEPQGSDAIAELTDNAAVYDPLAMPEFSLVQYMQQDEIITHVQPIVRAVCQIYNVAPVDFMSKRRTNELTWPRFVAYFVAAKMTGRSYPHIGRMMGGRDHTTILHGKQKVERRLIADPSVASEIIAVIQRVRSAASPATYSQETADAHASR